MLIEMRSAANASCDPARAGSTGDRMAGQRPPRILDLITHHRRPASSNGADQRTSTPSPCTGVAVKPLTTPGLSKTAKVAVVLLPDPTSLTALTLTV